MPKRRYTLTIVFDPDTEDLDWLCEEIKEEVEGVNLEVNIEPEFEEIDGQLYGVIDLAEYLDDETLEMIDDTYILAEA